jgi:hypothetical protein
MQFSNKRKFLAHVHRKQPSKIGRTKKAPKQEKRRASPISIIQKLKVKYTHLKY